MTLTRRWRWNLRWFRTIQRGRDFEWSEQELDKEKERVKLRHTLVAGQCATLAAFVDHLGN